MFDWFSGGSARSGGLEQMQAEFGQMLDAGHRIFDAAANAFLGGTDVEVIREDLFQTDKRINKAEQKIRRAIVVHASVHGTTSFPACLILMSVVKDAERVGDYAKNIFDLAELTSQPPAGPHRESLVALKDRISRLMADCRSVFDARDKPLTETLIIEAKKIEDDCDAQISKIISSEQGTELSVSYALAYRYFKRVASHVSNVLSSIVRPIDKLDFD